MTFSFNKYKYFHKSLNDFKVSRHQTCLSLKKCIDLRECLLNEFKTQMHIQNIVREMMQERYEIYLNRVQTKTLRKIHLKPQPIQPDEYPDISDDFFEEENQQFQDFLNIAYHPRTLNLYEDEINLKKFSILGGVFKLNFVKKPSQIECNNIHMIWHNPERKLIIEQDETISPLKSHRRSRSFRLSSIKSEIEILKEEIEPENPLFVMIFRLPEHLCYWSEPIACHYEVFEEEEIVEQEKAWNEYHKTVDNFLKSAESVFKEIGDEEFGEIGSLISKASKISIRPSQMKHFFESRVSDQLTLTEQLTFVDSGVYFVKDFSLNDPMDVQQARMLARSCTPYILPSFKFQKEITEELEGEPRSRKRRKSRKLGALRGRVQQQYIKSARLISWDSKQNNPEYMFSNFEKAPRIRVTTMLAPFEDKLPSEPITFYQLIRTLLSIKRLIKDQEHKRVARLAITIPLTPEEGSQNDSQKSGIIGKSIMKDSRSYIKQQQSAFGLTQKSSQYKKKSIAYKMKADVITKDSTSPKGEEKLLEEEGSITMKSENPIKNDEQQITVIRFEDSAEVAGEQEPIATTTEITTTEIPLITNDEKRESITTKEEDLSKGIEEIPKNPPVSGVEGHQKTDSEGDSVSVNTFDDTSSDSMEKQKLRTIKTSHWTTKYIKRFTFNKEENKFIIETDRLGYIGFAFKSYAHFPFKYWELEPNQTDPANEVIFTLETQHVKCIFSITNKGIRCRIIDPGPTQRPKEYFITEKPFTNISELKKILKEKNLNIFPDSDASFYIENGYYSEKHLATETHTYCCMALHSCFIKFSSSIWNRLAKRRDIILKFLQYEENPSAVVQVHITPEETRFVEVTEICTKGDEVKLAYTPTWRNINFYCDLHNAFFFYCDLHNAVISVENYALEKQSIDNTSITVTLSRYQQTVFLSLKN
uniref:CASC1 C-terminal domain-containing protein n=1 Tax=Glossina brevipalpis TaxID=37001 RepID=A0A1A9WBK4_9MUSC